MVRVQMMKALRRCFVCCHMETGDDDVDGDTDGIDIDNYTAKW